MVYRPLGRCGTKVSVYGLGGWTTFGGSVTDKSLVEKIITTAFEKGVNFFDIADVYSEGRAEQVMGSVLKRFPRHELVISSKVYFPVGENVNDRGLSRKHIMESVERSLKRIGTDYLDIYFCHRYDEETPFEETVRAMDDLIHQGKILYWGTSEWTAPQIRSTVDFCQTKNLYRPQVEQPQYSLVSRKKFEAATQPSLQEAGMGAVVWSPLGSGILTGKYDQGLPENSRLKRIEWLQEDFFNEKVLSRVRRMRKIADEAGCTRAQLALAWAASRRGVSSVITGATRLEQLQENLGALQVRINDDVKKNLDQLFPVE